VVTETDEGGCSGLALAWAGSSNRGATISTSNVATRGPRKRREWVNGNMDRSFLNKGRLPWVCLQTEGSNGRACLTPCAMIAGWVDPSRSTTSSVVFTVEKLPGMIGRVDHDSCIVMGGKRNREAAGHGVRCQLGASILDARIKINRE
jgi:hypothetical protein